jgi:hypothetical protein
MVTIWTEEQVSLINIEGHLEDCGKPQVSRHEDRISLYTEKGLSVSIKIDDDRKFLRINSYLPIDKSRSRADKLDLIQRYNSDMFLPGFCLDDDEDVQVNYLMCYERGLIVGQFMIVLNRFCSLLEYIIETQNQDDLIKFDQNSDGDDDEEGDVIDAAEPSASEDGQLALDGSRPKDAILN